MNIIYYFLVVLKIKNQGLAIISKIQYLFHISYVSSFVVKRIETKLRICQVYRLLKVLNISSGIMKDKQTIIGEGVEHQLVMFFKTKYLTEGNSCKMVWRYPSGWYWEGLLTGKLFLRLIYRLGANRRVNGVEEIRNVNLEVRLIWSEIIMLKIFVWSLRNYSSVISAWF